MNVQHIDPSQYVGLQRLADRLGYVSGPRTKNPGIGDVRALLRALGNGDAFQAGSVLADSLDSKVLQQQQPSAFKRSLHQTLVEHTRSRETAARFVGCNEMSHVAIASRNESEQVLHTLSDTIRAQHIARTESFFSTLTAAWGLSRQDWFAALALQFENGSWRVGSDCTQQQFIRQLLANEDLSSAVLQGMMQKKTYKRKIAEMIIPDTEDQVMAPPLLSLIPCASKVLALTSSESMLGSGDTVLQPSFHVQREEAARARLPAGSLEGQPQSG